MLLSTPACLLLLLQKVAAASKRGAKAAAVLEAVQTAAREDSHAARMRGPGEAAQRPLPHLTQAAAGNLDETELRDAAEADMWHDDPLDSHEEHAAEQAELNGAAVVSQQVTPQQAACTN